MGKYYDSALAAARLAPLTAAILAPLASLLAVPAVSQNWFADSNGDGVPDTEASLVLSGVSLGLVLIANALLVLRFSKAQKRWRIITTISTFVWITTTIIQIVNLVVHSVTRPAGLQHAEGFWCAIWSCVLSGSCTLVLLLHFLLQIGRPPSDELQVRLTGAHFMRNILGLVLVLALEAVIFSKIEGWEFFDGVYFAVVTMLTIGFGDLLPTYASTRVLLVPFALLTISLLANVISMLVKFLSALFDTRRQRWRTAYTQRAERAFGDTGSRPAGLQEEVNFLNRLGAREEGWLQLFDLGTSLLALVAFWFIGAVVFCKMEEWTYGIGLYFCYVFFLTLGYGDFAPRTAAGRTFFVLYSLLAVPIIASFALQAVSNVVSSWSDKRFSAQELGEEHGDGVVRAHAEFVLEHHSVLADQLAAFRKEHPSLPDEEVDPAFERALVGEMISLACALEAQSRRMLINQMPADSQAQVLLRADRNQQLRDMRSLGLPEEQLRQLMREEVQGDADVLTQVGKYRQTFAKFLATGARVQELRGREQEAFERRRGSRGEAVPDEDGNVAAGKRGASLEGYVQDMEAEKGPAGRGDSHAVSGVRKEAREQADSAGPSSGALKALNAA
ncbi:voltage-gated potassium channel [Calocera cornea HHB12733]|uniref:Voltage-gated potassium channel n=1 Tax=Calocera cornea HHB12733 TaxID=1353952 RepID=A0A165FWT8_9BASI|nr:voltage-gated potassium channel [Calocera cornea HHB12733]